MRVAPPHARIRPMRGWRWAAAMLVGACDAATPPPDATRGDVVDAADAVGRDDEADDAPEAAPPPTSVGVACETATPLRQGSCRFGELCLDARQGFDGGYCTRRCGATTACPAGTLCGDLSTFQVCLRRCVDDADCREGDGYRCVGRAGERVCRFEPEAFGALSDGAACHTVAPGAHALPALRRLTFASPNVRVSSTSTVVAAEGTVAASPTGRFVTAFHASDSSRTRLAVAIVTPTEVTLAPLIEDPLGTAGDPVVAYGPDGVLRLAWIGVLRDASGNTTRLAVRYRESADDGATWRPERPDELVDLCATGALCDKPWFAVVAGASPGASPRVYLGFLEIRSWSTLLYLTVGGDGAWGTASLLEAREMAGELARVPNLVQLAPGDDGEVAATWVMTAATATRTGAHGSPDNRVRFRRNLGGSAPNRTVSAPAHAPVSEQCPVVLDGAVAHVAFVSGQPNGAWDVLLATSVDDGLSWRYRKVNDEPETCASHAFPAMALDPETHALHLVWMENRFGDGAVAYARCPADPASPCSPNEAVSDQSFRFTTSRVPTRWHGDYLGIARGPSGDLLAVWSDTRTGTPAMYMARGRPR